MTEKTESRCDSGGEFKKAPQTESGGATTYVCGDCGQEVGTCVGCGGPLCPSAVDEALCETCAILTIQGNISPNLNEAQIAQLLSWADERGTLILP